MKFITSAALDGLNPSGALLRFRVKWDGSRRIVSVNAGYRVDPSGWSSETFRCRPRTLHGRRRVPASEINAELAALEAAAARAAARFPGCPSVEEFRAAFREEIGRRSGVRASTGIVADLDEFVSSEGARCGWTYGTARSFSGLKKHLASFEAGVGRRLAADDFDDRLLEDFVVHLRRAGLRNSSAAAVVKKLRWLLSWDVRQGRAQVRAFESFEPQLKQTSGTVVFLDWGEVFRLMDADLPERLVAARDVFLFCCFTGLRHSDAEALRVEDLSDGAVTFTARKTAELLRVELNRYSRAILEKYEDFARSTGRLLPVPCNQLMNRELKEACRLAGIDAPVHRTYYRGPRRVDETVPKWQAVGTHAGRRTFVCLMLGLGVPVTTVMKWTGHSDFKAMRPYIGVSDRARASAMSLVDSVPRPEKSGTENAAKSGLEDSVVDSPAVPGGFQTDI